MGKEGTAVQESRLFKIVYYLLDRGQATAPELAERFEVSVRTIYRDIDALSAAGIPIYAEAGRNGGIRLMHDFVLDHVVLSGEEKREILAALQSINITRNIAESQTLQKLSALFALPSENWLEIDFSRWGNQGFDKEKFELLKTAVIHCRQIRIRYAGSDGTERERTVQPYRLVYRSKAWYLKAFCMEKQEMRTFKLNRILELALLEESFVRRSFPEEPEDDEGNYPLVTLRFPKEMAYRVYDEFDGSQIERQENGDLTAAARMPEGPWLISFLLSFGTQVEILSPAYLREEIVRQAEKIVEKYKA